MYKIFIPIYDILFILASLKYILRYALRRRLKEYLIQRLFLPRVIKEKLKNTRRPIWIHAVSVGEVKSLSRLIDKLREKYPQKKIVLSVVTDQGRLEAARLYGSIVIVFYLPLDISFIIRPVVKLISPHIFIVAETEIWPNLYYFLNKEGVPIIIFNARISDNSFKFYKLSGFILKHILRKVSFVAAQDNTAGERFCRLGLEESSLRVTGNMKYNSIQPDSIKIKETERKWAILKRGGSLLIIAGSTHYPEEQTIAKIFKKMVKRGLNLNLLICPRHLERVPGIVKSLKDRGFTPLRISQLNGENYLFSEGIRVLLLDTMGELLYFYSLADIVFVGGSLADCGGHNILEPAYFKKPVIVGPHMYNFKEIKDNFLQNKALVQVKDEKGLEDKLSELTEDAGQRERLGSNARRLIDNSNDTLKENLALLDKFMY